MILTGVPSGDYECWCFLVDRETFKAVKGKYPEDPTKDETGHEMLNDVGHFAVPGSPYKYMVYPSDLIKVEDNQVTTICVEYNMKAPAVDLSKNERP